MMPRFWTLLAFLIALTVAFAPVASVAMAKSCTMTMEMTADGTTHCACHNTMPNCDSMPQCRTGSGCASQCFNTFGVLSTLTGQIEPDHVVLKMGANSHAAWLSIKPPSPPPRA